MAISYVGGWGGLPALVFLSPLPPLIIAHLVGLPALGGAQREHNFYTTSANHYCQLRCHDKLETV